MKDKIVIEIPKDMCDNCNSCDRPTSAQIECYLEESRQLYETVKEPETFEELKALFLDKLKELNVMWFGDRFVENKSEEFWVKGILFKADKTLSIRDDNDNIRVIMTKIDYPLMWLLIQTTLNTKPNHL